MKIDAFGMSRALMLLVTALLLVLSFFGNNVNFIGIVVFILYVGIIFIYKPIELANNLLFFIAIVPMVIGGALIENGTYLFEIDKYGRWNGTFIVNLFFSILFIEFLIYPVKAKYKKSCLTINRFFVEAIILCVLIILYGTLLKTGVPLFNGIHRSDYFGSIVPSYVNLTKGRLSFICLALGYYYYTYKSKRYLGYFILIVAYHILCSIKGGELLIVIYAFYLPVTLFLTMRMKSEKLKKVYKKIRYGLFVFASGILLILIFNYQTVENYDQNSSALEKIEKRIEAAGQIWWVINDEAQVESKFRLDDFLDNFSSEVPDVDKGMNQLMTEIVPEKILSVWRAPDARYKSLANGFPAIGFYYFGYFGVFGFILIIGCVIVLIKKAILSSFENGDVLSFLFLGPLLEIVIRVVAQGDINLFFETRTYAIIFMYLIYCLVKSLMRRANAQ